MKRNEIISHSKKVPKKRNYEEELEGEDNYLDRELFKYQIRNTDDNYVIRKDFSAKKKENELFENNKNKILITDNAYVMRDSQGQKAEIKKEDLEGVTCLKKEKEKLLKKAEKKDGQLIGYLKAEIERELKIKKMQKRQEKIQQNLNKFNYIKNKKLKLIENDRYKDNQNIYERQKLIQKFFSQNEVDMNQANNIYDLNIDVNNPLSASYGNMKTNPNMNSIKDKKQLKKDKSESKIEKLKTQIKDYEKKNEEFKQKIVNMFELNKKLNKMEEKFEVEKYRREMALINNMDKYQNKINKLLLEREEKEEKIKNAKIKQEKEREKKIDERAIIIDKTKQNKITEAKKNEEKRQKLIKDIEKNELRNYAIKEEKKKLYEERKKMNKIKEEEKEEMRIKIQEAMKNKKILDDGKDEEKTEDIIKKVLKGDNNNNSLEQ